jgi:hypothetical protein
MFFKVRPTYIQLLNFISNISWHEMVIQLTLTSPRSGYRSLGKKRNLYTRAS